MTFRAVIAAVLLSIGVLHAHDAAEPFSEWMMSLKRPDYPASPCCGPSDQIYVDDYKVDPSGDGFLVDVVGRSVHVPRVKVIWDRVNPTGRGVLFWSPHLDGSAFIFCFVPGSGA